MTELLRSDFQALADASSTCISIYMPAEKAGAETRKNPIRFKNLIREAEEKGFYRTYCVKLTSKVPS